MIDESTIDEINALVYDKVNNGVYKAGFATAQPAYEEAVLALAARIEELAPIGRPSLLD